MNEPNERNDFQNLRPDEIQELNALGGLVDRAAYNQKYGSFSARNPLLGKMVNCPKCGRRHRQFESDLCGAGKYLKTNEAEQKIKGRKNPRLSRNRPPFLEIHERLVVMEKDPNFQEYEGISGVVEAQIKRERKAEAKRIRDQQKHSRKQNRRKK